MTVTTPRPQGSADTARLLQAAADLAGSSGLFGPVRLAGLRVECDSAQRPEDARYRLGVEDGRIYVSWVTPDRYLSQSIEADLMWTGDDLDEMFAEELADLGWSGPALGGVEHFRSDEKLFTFRSAVPAAAEQDAGVLVKALLAYEAVFRELGDMKGDEDE